VTLVTDAGADLSAGVVPLRRCLSVAQDRLRRCSVPSPRFDAEEIAAHLLQVPRSELWRYLDGQVPAGFTDLIRRRSERIPLQHITGVAYFRHETLSVGPGVFIPRPETEVVVEKALSLLDANGGDHPVVVDLGSGSGAIARAIATECPRAHVHAVEIDPGAQPWLKQNVRSVGVTVHPVDMARCLPELDRSVDLVISNPPYIPEEAVPRDPEVARYDPSLALYSGADGLDHVRVVEQTASRLLRVGGWVVVEHADQQGSTAPAVFASAAGWTHVRDHRDLTGRDRFVTAQRG
jgi:release factor glutamine methyltransferase